MSEAIYLGNLTIEHIHGQRRLLGNCYSAVNKRALSGYYGAACGQVWFSTSTGLIEAVIDPAKSGSRGRVWRLTEEELQRVRKILELFGPYKHHK